VPKSHGKMEAEICDAFKKLLRELTGRGPEDIRTYILNDMVIIRLKGVLTTEEKHLAQTETGKKLIKSVRRELRESHSAAFDKIITDYTGCGIVSSHSDISTKTGERVEIFILDCDLQSKLTKEKLVDR